MKFVLKNRLYNYLLLVLLIVIALSWACSRHSKKPNYYTLNEFIHYSKSVQSKTYLKAHLKNGHVIILNNKWVLDTISDVISGRGSHYDLNRNPLSEGELKIPVDSISLIETNRKLSSAENDRIATLSILGSLDVILGVVCLTVPKACFGSCPTVYLEESGSVHNANAECFSNAILPNMEYEDIDAIGRISTDFAFTEIYLKNEALETHCIKYMNLLTFPVKEGEEVFLTPDHNFYLCENSIQPAMATDEKGSVLNAIYSKDGIERFSETDSSNLHSIEEIQLEFDIPDTHKKYGLQVDFRQTLLTTYLFYSALGYMGDEIGDHLSNLNQDSNLQKNFDRIMGILGPIDILMRNNNGWTKINSFNETGPIATNSQIIEIPQEYNSGKMEFKILLNRGLWRLDCIQLLEIKKEIRPTRLRPSYIIDKYGKKQDTQMLNDSNAYFISLPGDEYKLGYDFPDHNQYALFIESKGYYLEWMRESWYSDKNIKKLFMMVYAPELYMRIEAADFKKYESKMEEIFWNSKIDSKTVNYYENI